MKKRGKESLITRCSECKPEDVSTTAATQAKSILDPFNKDNVKRVASCAVSLYAWVRVFI